MMRSRPVRTPVEFVIWGASALLGVMAGVAAASTLWGRLHLTGGQDAAAVAIVLLAIGFALVALAIEDLSARLFFMGAGAALVIALLVGATLVPPLF